MKPKMLPSIGPIQEAIVWGLFAQFKFSNGKTWPYPRWHVQLAGPGSAGAAALLAFAFADFPFGGSLAMAVGG